MSALPVQNEKIILSTPWISVIEKPASPGVEPYYVIDSPDFAVVVATGLTEPIRLGIPGEELAIAALELLSEAGIDVSKPEFWQGGFDVLNGLVSQLEALPITH